MSGLILHSASITGATAIGAANATLPASLERDAISISSSSTAFGLALRGSGIRLAFPSDTGTTAAPLIVADHNCALGYRQPKIRVARLLMK